MRAAATDLRQEERHLRWIGAGAQEDLRLPPEERRRLARLAKKTAAALGRLAAALAAVRMPGPQRP